MTASTVYLFSYGTLQDKAVQLANFGRELTGSADAMLGYEQSWVEITDPEVLAASGKTHHPILRPGSDSSAPIPGWYSRSPLKNWRLLIAMKYRTTSALAWRWRPGLKRGCM